MSHSLVPFPVVCIMVIISHLFCNYLIPYWVLSTMWVGVMSVLFLVPSNVFNKYLESKWISTTSGLILVCWGMKSTGHRAFSEDIEEIRTPLLIWGLENRGALTFCSGKRPQTLWSKGNTEIGVTAFFFFFFFFWSITVWDHFAEIRPSGPFANWTRGMWAH